MEGDPNQSSRKMKKSGTRQSEVSIFDNPAVWSEQAEELYQRGEPAEPETSSAPPVGDTHADGSVFSMSTFSDISGSIKYAMGFSDTYGDDSYVQQPSVEASLEPNRNHNNPFKPQADDSVLGMSTFSDVGNSTKDAGTTGYSDIYGDDSYLQQPSIETPRDTTPRILNQYHKRNHQQQQQRQTRNDLILPDLNNNSPKTPPRSKEEEEQFNQKQALHTLTPKTEISNSDATTVMSAPVDQRCCGLFRRAFEQEKIFRRLIHVAVAMLIVFSMLSIYVIVRSSEANRAKAANSVPSPTFAPLKPTMLRPPSAGTAAPSMRGPTMAPTALTASTLKEIVVQAFPGAITAIDDPSSAQSRALAWLTSDDSMDAFFVTEKLIQRWALAVLYFSTNGEGWRTKDKWLTNHDECEWYTADPYTPVCDDDGRVNSLHLRNNGLSGTLPDELTLLSNSLEFLYLNDGMIEGTIPSSYGKLSNLKRFYLQVNKLSGTVPSEVSGMELLENLAIGRNQLTGTIPTDLVLMDELRLIDMSSNQIGGPIPTVFGQLSNLSSFTVNENRLTGTIPSEFGQLQNLISLVVQDNQLEGSVPWEVCEMRDSRTFFWLTVDCDRVSCSGECSCQCD